MTRRTYSCVSSAACLSQRENRASTRVVGALPSEKTTIETSRLPLALARLRPFPPGSREDSIGDTPEAVWLQLGLKLDKQKAPVEMLVVDSGEKHPIVN